MRFVILDHKPDNRSSPSGRTEQQHFDLMFEVKTGEKLRTFALVKLPAGPTDEVDAESLPDHRSEYLTYEGDLTGNRGSVTRFAEGAWEGDLGATVKLVFDDASANFPGTSWEIQFAADQRKLLRIL